MEEEDGGGKERKTREKLFGTYLMLTQYGKISDLRGKSVYIGFVYILV